MEIHKSCIDPNLSKSSSSLPAKTSGSGRTHSAVTQEAHRQASAKYRWNYRKHIQEQGLIDEAYLGHTRGADQKYRTKNAELIAFKQRRRRQDAYIAKHGQQAYLVRCAQQQAASDAKWELAHAEAAHAATQAQEEHRAQAARNRALALMDTQ
ncbi:hypothetical protein DFH09DRAFT_1080713 [Mycena vulgaris]|nr:hypothetical protein DFH09DRAFT_1080705 [Mycena vulgaris]KAJ6568336.1 hypothetical protein DFH09DRAFT_1080713 [Mycena vulgaris]